MNILPAREVKRRGVKALEIALKNGPVHIIKNNTQTCVVLAEEDYRRLTSLPIQQESQNGALQWLLNRQQVGTKERAEIDGRLLQEREDWEK